MLRQRRALQAQTTAIASRSNSVQFSESGSSCADLCFEPDPLPSTPSYVPPRQFPSYIPSEESACHLDQQVLETYLQQELLPDSFPSLQDFLPCHPTSSYQPPSHCFNQSLDPGSPTDSSDFSGSFEYSYSPLHQQPLYPVVAHSSPAHLDVKNCGFMASGEYSYQVPYNPSTCCCVACHGPQGFDSTREGEYLPYPSTDCMDYHTSPVTTDDFFRRELNSFDMCYS